MNIAPESSSALRLCCPLAHEQSLNEARRAYLSLALRATLHKRPRLHLPTLWNLHISVLAIFSLSIKSI